MLCRDPFDAMTLGPICRSGRKQSGVVLLEALVAILIFSLGILALVGLQANSVRMTTEAKYRSDASLLTEQIIGLMWADDRANLPGYAHAPGGANCVFNGAASANANVTAWLGGTGLAGTVIDTLPNVQAQIVIGAQNVVTVTLCWMPPGGGAFNQHSVMAQISQ
ncbi:MAG: hypothetical protein IOMNBAOH_00255 [Rhodocyclaceae bacterium]|nr:hypothetical protein [Rhodocyclaceae bacterium]